MNQQFFKQTRPRHNNPTFQSRLVHSSMLFPYSKYQVIKHQYLNGDINKDNIIRRKDQSTLAQASRNYPSRQFQTSNMQNSNQNMKNIPMTYSSVLEDPYSHRRSKSNLQSYGSTSLANLPKIQDKNVFQNQQKNYNIINLCPKQYKQSIKMFPKFRNQIKQDYPHKIRNAFISGKPQIGLDSSRKLKANNQASQVFSGSMNYKSMSMQKLNPEASGHF